MVLEWLREPHPGGPDVEMPVATFRGPKPGPTIAITAGMHSGEYAGVWAAIELIRWLETVELSGTVIVVPVVSYLAFLDRSMQLSPVDQHELHYLWPGNPAHSHSHHVIDLLYRTIGECDAHVDMHGGEAAQELTPYVCVPWLGDGEVWDRSLALAQQFDVPFIDKRRIEDTQLALPKALLERGIPNIWTEIGCNAIPRKAHIDLQRNGAVNVLRLYGVVRGRGGPRRTRAPRIVGPQHWSVFADQSGIWKPGVRAGEHVRKGQSLGALYDLFGRELATYAAEADAIVEYVCTSSGINADRRPAGYRWHQHLVQLAEDPEWR